MSDWEPYDDFDEARFRAFLDAELPPSEGHRAKAVKRMRWTLYVLYPLLFLIQVAVLASDLAHGKYWLSLIPGTCLVFIAVLGVKLRRIHMKFLHDFEEKDVEVEVELQNAIERGEMDRREAAIILEKWKQV